MVQGLQLSTRLTQSMVLAPQLQQSLALLQAPTLELKALVEQELQQNPVLEEVEGSEVELPEKPSGETGENSDATAAADPAERAVEAPEESGEVLGETPGEAPADDFQEEFDKLVQLDQEWRDQFSPSNAPVRASAEDEERRQFMFDSLTAGTSFTQMLMDQARESNLTAEQLSIAELIIGNIDEYGYLKATVEEISAASQLPAGPISEVLGVIKTFDPAGHRCLRLAGMPPAAARAGRQAGRPRVPHHPRSHGGARQAAHP